VANSTHKKIVYAGFGCVGVFVALAIVGLVFIRQSGMSMGPQPRSVSPVQAAAALAELERIDLSASLPQPPSDDWRPDARSLRGAGHVAFSSKRIDEVVAQFGDTYPSGSMRRAIWIGQAALATVTADSGRTTARPDDLAAGAVLLALARKLSDQGHASQARVAIAEAIGIGRSLANGGDLRELVAGWRIERDAATMLSGSVTLGGDVTQRAHARGWAAWADSVIPGLRALNLKIETAGASPSSVPELAGWVQDSSVPVPLRRAIFRAVAKGWVDDPVEKMYGVSARRDTAVHQLLHVTLPYRLSDDIEDAQADDQPGYIDRIRIGAAMDRERARYEER
jgi:hypothetical protein